MYNAKCMGGVGVIDPSKVAATAKLLVNENQKFRRFLKNHADPDELDKHFEDLHNELFRDYDCCKCTNCCRVYSISLRADEIDRISAHLGLTTIAFIDEYLTQSANGYELNAPCRLLNADGRCVVHVCKPSECREYPYTDKPERLESLLGVMSFAEVCPVVFEIVKRLKDIYRFVGRE